MAARRRSDPAARDARCGAGDRARGNRREGRRLTAGRLIGSIILPTLVAATGVRSLVTQRIQAQNAENRQLEVALRPLRRETAEVDALTGVIADFLARSQVTKVLAESSSPAAEAFAELSRLSGDIVLNEARVDQMHIVAAGIARSDAAARQMVEQLAAAQFFVNPRIARTDPAPAGDPYGPAARAFRLEADLRH